jgi:hypothetical protein
VNKYNLAFNSQHNIFKCWKCGESGIVHKIVQKYGGESNYKKLKLILPVYSSEYVNVFRKPTINHNLLTCPMPDGYTPLTKTINSPMYKLAFDYVTKTRGITLEQIELFKIGYTEVGAYRNRIIIPSFNQTGNINYFEARTFLEKVKPSYYKPDQKVFEGKNVPDKYDIIFNEFYINWDLPIYLVEGVFDALRIPNSIPMLGKVPSWLLISNLIEHKCTVVVCLDEDAFRDGLKIYENLSSLGLDVYFVDLYKKGDVSSVYETHGRNGVINLLKSKKRMDLLDQLSRILKK